MVSTLSSRDYFNICLLITGDFLLRINTEELRERLINIAAKCNGVIASRVSPK